MIESRMQERERERERERDRQREESPAEMAGFPPKLHHGLVREQRERGREIKSYGSVCNILSS